MNIIVFVQHTRVSTEGTDSLCDSFSHSSWKPVEKRPRGKDNLSSSLNNLNAQTRILAREENDHAQFELFCISFRKQLQDQSCSVFPAQACTPAGKTFFFFFVKFCSKQASDCWDLTSLALES